MKTLVSTSLLLLASVAFGAPSGHETSPSFDCGVYLVAGHFGQNARGEFTLTMRKDTSSPFEILVFGGDLQEKQDKIDLDVVVEVEVPRAIRSARNALVVLRKFSDQGMGRGQDKKFLVAKDCSQ